MNDQTLSAALAIDALQKYASKERAISNVRFFKTGKGEYGEGDEFIGATVPDTRKVAKAFVELSIPEVKKLLASSIHEVRMLGLIIWTLQFAKSNEQDRCKIFDAYLASASRINNWDLVDVSAPNIIGEHLVDSDRDVLLRLAKSKILWERRIAMVATLACIRRGDASTTLQIADLLLHDREDLMHKATGWMLREVGKHCGVEVLGEYLRSRYSKLSRTALRYAIEHFSAVERRRWLLGKV
ncbi:MAG: DNA alkylation repair protein [Patescibacteria group bacterium]